MTLSRNAQDQELLIDYVRQALAQLDAGTNVDPVALTAAHPHLARPLAEVLGLHAELPQLQGEAVRIDPLAGLVLAGRYRLDACRGRGAMGVVYAAEDRELRRAVAVKILDARLFRDEQAEQRFAREAEALATLQHPHVVTVFDRGRTPEGIFYLVMELLEGATLAAVLDRLDAGSEPAVAVGEALGAPPAEVHWPRLAARWAAAIAHGLAAAHARGLVHRDVKPSNVFVRRDGRPVLLDFGIAARDDGERLTATQTTLGTPWYMAPEQVRSSSTGTASAGASPAQDVYALGATLYHLLAGRPPYEGDAAAVLAALPARDPKPLAGQRAGLPRDLVAIVERCLERRPQDRYPDGAALAADLDAFLAHQPVSARPVSLLARRLRQWRRAPAKPIAVAALLLAFAVLAVAAPLHLREQRAALQRQKADLYATLPSVLAIEGWPDERVLQELHGEHAAALELLDRILALDRHDLPVRLWRAALLLDLDEREAAAADLLQIAYDAGGGYIGALAERYRRANPQQAGAFSIDTSGLPEPLTPQECYVAGFHELRARHLRGYAERADALLLRAAADYLPARDLRLLSLASRTETTPEPQRSELIEQLYDETVELEVIYGRETARTQAMRGLARILRKDYAAAVPCLLRSLELRPGRHGPHQNLGIAYLRLGDIDESQRHLDRALALRPFAWNTKYTQAQLATARGDHAAAYEWAAKVPTEGPFGLAWKQPNLLGNIAVDEAVKRLRDDPAAGREIAGRAIAAYDRALAARPRDVRLQRRRQLAVALQQQSLSAAMTVYARMLLDGDGSIDPNDDPLGPYQLRNLAFLMPAELGPAETAWIAALLRRVAAEAEGADEALRTQLLAEIEAGLARFR